MGGPPEEDDVDVRVEGAMVPADVIAVSDGLTEEMMARFATSVCHQGVSLLADSWEGNLLFTVQVVVVGLADDAGAPHEDAWLH